MGKDREIGYGGFRMTISEPEEHLDKGYVSMSVNPHKDYRPHTIWVIVRIYFDRSMLEYYDSKVGDRVYPEYPSPTMAMRAACDIVTERLEKLLERRSQEKIDQARKKAEIRQAGVIARDLWKYFHWGQPDAEEELD